MSKLDFSFDDSPWERLLDNLKPGSSLMAGNFLTMMEGEQEEVLEDALRDLEDKNILLDVKDLAALSGGGQAALRLRQEQQMVQKGLNPGELDKNDPLRLYLEELAGIPVCGDPQLLAEQSRTGDDRATEALTNLCLGQVVAAAREYTGCGVLLMDLIQEGNLGLWQAISSWEAGDFPAFADRKIRMYMTRAIALQARSNGLGQHLREAMEDYKSVDEQLLVELGRNPTLEEIADRMHMTPETADSVSTMVENARLLARATRVPEPEQEKEAEEQSVEDTAYFQMRQRIGDLLSELSPEDARLLTLRFGLEGGLPLSPEETGKKLNLTPQEVVAREAAALRKLRET